MVTLLRSRKRLNACTSDRLSGEGRRKTCQGLGGPSVIPVLGNHVLPFAEPRGLQHTRLHRLNQPVEQVTHMLLSSWARSVFGAPLGVQGCLYLGKPPLAII